MTREQLELLIDRRQVTLDYTRGEVSGITIDYGKRSTITTVPAAWVDRLRKGQVATPAAARKRGR